MEGQAAPERAPYNLLLSGVPQAPKDQVKTVIISHLRSEVSPHLTFVSCSAARMDLQGLPHTDQGLLLFWPPAGHSWNEMLHSMEQRDRLKPYMPIWMKAQVALPIRHLLMQPVCCHKQTQRPEDHVNKLSNTWEERDTGCIMSYQIAFWRSSHEQGPTEPGQLLTQGAMTGGCAEKSALSSCWLSTWFRHINVLRTAGKSPFSSVLNK